MKYEGRANAWLTPFKAVGPSARSQPWQTCSCITRLDLWMTRMHPDLPWCRYADDGLVHCRKRARSPGTQGRAPSTIGRMPPGNASDENQDRLLQGREPQRQVSEYSDSTSSDTAFGPGWSSDAPETTRCSLGLQPGGQRFGVEGHAGGEILGTEPPTSDRLAYLWMRSHGRSIRSCGGGSNTTDDTRRRLCIQHLLRYVNQMLLAWAMRKFKRFKAHRIRASRFLQRLAQENAGLFVHWRLGMTGTFA